MSVSFFLLACIFIRVSIFVSAKYDIKIGLMLPKDDPVLKPTIGYGTSAGAITLAMQRIREEHLLDGANFIVEPRFPECHELKATNTTVELFFIEKMDLIIGPACSIAVVTGLYGGAFNLPLIVWSAKDPQLGTESRFPTLISTIGTTDSLGRGVTEIMIHFNWRQAAFFYTDDKTYRTCNYIYQGFHDRMLHDGVDIYESHVTLARGKRPTEKEMDKFLDNVAKEAKIVIICFDMLADRRRFMLKAHNRGMDTDDYVYIFPEYVSDENKTEVWKDFTGAPPDYDDGNNEILRQAFKQAFIIEAESIDSEQLHSFKLQVPQIMKQSPFFYESSLPDEQYGSIYSPFMFDAMYLYALSLNTTIGKKGTENEVNSLKRNGRAIFNNARNREFKGMSGGVIMNPKSIRIPNFVMKGYYGGNSWKEVAIVHSKNNDGDTVKLLTPEWQIWANRKDQARPIDRPICGWAGELCKDEKAFYLQLGLGLGLTLLLIVASAISVTMYIRNKKASLKLQAGLWQINPGELIHIKPRKVTLSDRIKT